MPSTKVSVARLFGILYSQILAQSSGDSIISTASQAEFGGSTADGIGNSPVAQVSTSTALFFVVLTATVVITPLFFLGNPSGHDIQFHISSWMDVVRQWHQGILFPRWCEWANWGFGEPRFIFYPPVSWLLGAALGSLGQWNMVPGAMIWIALVIAGMAMWMFTRDWLPGSWSVVAAVLFTADPYRLVILYYRSDFAELLGASLFPVLFWGALRLGRRDARWLPGLVAAFAAIWLCNAPAGVIATYSLVLAMGIASVLARSLRPLAVGGVAIACAFAIDAFYIIPAAYEQRWVQIATALTSSLQPIHNFLFAHDNELGFVEFNMRTSRVAVCMMLGTLIAAGILYCRRRNSPASAPEQSKMLWTILMGAAIASSFLMTRTSFFLWKLLPKLQFIQFPWRWMDALAVPLAFFVAAAAASFKKRWASGIVLLIAASGLITIATIIIQDAWWDSKDASYLMRGIEAGHGFDGMDEYAPRGVSHWDLPGEPKTDDRDATPPAETPRVEQISETGGDVVAATGIQVSYRTWNAERRSFSVKTDAPARLVLRLVNYPAWDVRLDGTKIPPDYVDTTGQMIVPVPAGRHEIDIRFVRTWDRSLGGLVSLAALGGFVFFSVGRRKSPLTNADRRPSG